MGHWQSREQLMELLCNLVRVPSITGSSEEGIMPEVIAEQLQRLKWFSEHPDYLQIHRPADGGSFVTALVRSKKLTSHTVVLVSHYDVVGVDDYGEWKPVAFDVKKLTSDFYEQPEQLPELVQRDMVNGDWVFGRGVMDMKAGLTLHMSMLEHAVDEGFDGNVLLLTVSDEEVNSAGMRAAVPGLVELAERFGLTYDLVLNAEPMFFRTSEDARKYTYKGSIGKVLPGFLCYGKETHVGEPFAGLNANYMIARLTSAIEMNTTLSEVVDRDVTPPPTNLIHQSLQAGYSVQVPFRAVTMFNFFLLEKSPQDVANELLAIARTVAEDMRRQNQSHADFCSKHGMLQSENLEVRVLTYKELVLYAEHAYGATAVEELIDQAILECHESDDRQTTICIVDKIASLCRELAPMMVLFFAPPLYPAVTWRNHPLVDHVLSKLEHEANTRYAISFEQENYFFGISDLSYVGTPQGIPTLGGLTNNMPLWKRGYSVPFESMEKFAVPVLNVGPVGRDAHKWTERLDVKFAFEKLRELLPGVISSVFQTVTTDESEVGAEDGVN